MQIISLQFEGIGPFAKRYSIDFQELGQSGLFLLEGPTGSGKSTILDAIVFALYGEVAGGSDSSKGRIVSTKLPAGVEPFVDLTVDTKHRGLLRVRRTPAYERPKSRGDGTTQQPATIKLWKLGSADDEVGEPVSTRMDEANDELRRAIGLSREQFTQTVMLPQGHFAVFLKAKPDERRDVLQEIFGTELYEKVKTKLEELATSYKQQKAEALQQVRFTAADFCQLAWADDAKAATEPIPEQVAFDAAVVAENYPTVLGSAAERIAVLNEQVAAAHAKAVDADLRRDRAVGVLQSAEARNDRITEREALLARAAALKEAAPAVEWDAALLKAADKAEHARPCLRQNAKARDALDKARIKAAELIEAAAEGPNADLVTPPRSVDDLHAQAAEARHSAGTLDHLVELEANLSQRTTDLAQQVAELDADRKATTQALAAVAEDRVQIEAAKNELSEHDEAAAEVVPATKAAAESRRRLDAAEQVSTLTTQIAKHRKKEDACQKAYEEAQRVHAEARSAWLDGLAGEVAETLVKGEACPVCGSPEHPAPASRPTDSVGRDEVDDLTALVEAAATKLAAARTTTGHLVDQLAEQTRLTDALDLSAATAAYAQATERLEAATQASKTAKELRERIAKDTKAADDTERRLHEAEAAQANRKGVLEAKGLELKKDRLAVADCLAGFDSVTARRSALTARADLAEHLATVFRAEKLASEDVAHRATELAEVLSEHGFPTPEAAKAALLDESERTLLRTAIDQHRTDVATVNQQLAADRLAGLADQPLHDLEPLRTAATEAAEEAVSAHHWTGMVEKSATSTKAAAAALTEHVDALTKLRAEAEPYLRMAALASGGGGNLQQMTLPTWMLLRSFEDVVDHANSRLDAMSGGRYELRRTDEREGRTRLLGLGLVVVDHHSNDATRDPRTLSGGETFMASLALALGLADAVTSKAGGIKLETLFVDEGFGALDDQALDSVMTQLSALKAGGRSVGVVSHVAELKQRITEQISVRANGDGTSTLTCTNESSIQVA